MTKPELSQKSITPEQTLSFRDATRRQIETWPHNIPEYNAVPGTQSAFEQMGETFRQRILEDSVGERFKSSGSYGGLAVIPRFLYAGAAKAALLGYDLGQIETAMYHKKTYQALTLLTTEPNAVGVQLELLLGLRSNGPEAVNTSLSNYTFDAENGLGYTDFKRVRGHAIIDAINRGKEFTVSSENGRSLCEGQRAGVLAMAYRAMMMISLADPNLFQATIAHRAIQEEAVA